MGGERYEDSNGGSRLPSPAEGNSARSTPRSPPEGAAHRDSYHQSKRHPAPSTPLPSDYSSFDAGQKVEGRQQHDSEGLLQLLTQGGPHQLLSSRGSSNATVIAQVRMQKGRGGPRGTWKAPNEPGRTGKTNRSWRKGSHINSTTSCEGVRCRMWKSLGDATVEN